MADRKYHRHQNQGLRYYQTLRRCIYLCVRQWRRKIISATSSGMVVNCLIEFQSNFWVNLTLDFVTHFREYYLHLAIRKRYVRPGDLNKLKHIAKKNVWLKNNVHLKPLFKPFYVKFPNFCKFYFIEDVIDC